MSIQNKPVITDEMFTVCKAIVDGDVVIVDGLLMPKLILEEMAVAYVLKDDKQANSMSTLEEAIASHLRQSMVDMARFLHLREQLAISGAMRWVWSQEAPISKLRMQFKLG